MKSAAGPLLVAASLVLGVLSATTSYLVPVDRIDLARGDRVVLQAPAGSVADPGNPQAPPQPVLVPGPPGAPLILGQAELDTLRAAGVDRIHATQFCLRHWQEAWWFALACLGLVSGAGLIRRSARRRLAAAGQPDPSSPASAVTPSPERLLDLAIDRTRHLRHESRSNPDPRSRLIHLMRAIESIQTDCLQPLEAARPVIIHRHGMAGYARLMDRFAAAERQLHRAWSASADQVPAEAAECLDRGLLLLEEARARLG